MNRRGFLKLLGIGAATVAAPVYFDMGRGLWRQQALEKQIAEIDTFFKQAAIDDMEHFADALRYSVMPGFEYGWEQIAFPYSIQVLGAPCEVILSS